MCEVYLTDVVLCKLQRVEIKQNALETQQNPHVGCYGALTSGKVASLSRSDAAAGTIVDKAYQNTTMNWS